eukprot:COSAG03_NODE_599_length_6773_cov_6.193737_7_plen_80_part_00
MLPLVYQVVPLLPPGISTAAASRYAARAKCPEIFDDPPPPRARAGIRGIACYGATRALRHGALDRRATAAMASELDLRL